MLRCSIAGYSDQVHIWLYCNTPRLPRWQQFKYEPTEYLYCFQIRKHTQKLQNLDAFESRFLVLKAVLGRQNSTKQLLSFSNYLLIPLLNFVGIGKNWPKIDQKP